MMLIELALLPPNIAKQIKQITDGEMAQLTKNG